MAYSKTPTSPSNSHYHASMHCLLSADPTFLPQDVCIPPMSFLVCQTCTSIASTGNARYKCLIALASRLLNTMLSTVQLKHWVIHYNNFSNNYWYNCFCPRKSGYCYNLPYGVGILKRYSGVYIVYSLLEWFNRSGIQQSVHVVFSFLEWFRHSTYSLVSSYVQPSCSWSGSQNLYAPQ